MELAGRAQGWTPSTPAALAASSHSISSVGSMKFKGVQGISWINESTQHGYVTQVCEKNAQCAVWRAVVNGI